MNKNKSKIYMIISICLLCISILGTSVAYYREILFNQNANTVTHGLDYYINYTKGQDISGLELQLSSDYTSGNSSDIELWKKDDTYDIYGHIYLDINEISSSISESSALKYTVVNNGDIISEGSLKGSAAGDSILLSSNIPLQTTKQLYSIYIWIDESEDIDGLISGEVLSLTVRCEATMKTITSSVNSVNLLTHITNLYTNAEKTEVTNNDIVYNYATSVSLMNDRLGGITEDYNSGNIRYYGSNPNNYIDIGDVYTEDTVIDNFEKNSQFLNFIGITDSESCYEFFDCSTNYEAIGNLLGIEYVDEESCNTGFQNYYHISSVDDMCGTTTKSAGDPKLYRAIGMFKDVELADGTTQDLVKVIREDSIGNLSWDLKGTNDSTMTFDSNWHNATLQTMLNGAYYNASSTIHSYMDFLNGDYFFENTIDFKESGLNSRIKDKIETVVWNLGGAYDTYVYSNEMYQHERGDVKCDDCTYKTTWPGKIALIYPSDYGYAIDFSSCSATLDSYASAFHCFGTDWLISFSHGNAIEWTLTPTSYDGGVLTWNIFGGGVFQFTVDYGVGVRPVFYLDSKLVIETGDGSIGTPYVVR